VNNANAEDMKSVARVHAVLRDGVSPVKNAHVNLVVALTIGNVSKAIAVNVDVNMIAIALVDLNVIPERKNVLLATRRNYCGNAWITLTVIIMKNVWVLILDREFQIHGGALHLFELGEFVWTKGRGL